MPRKYQANKRTYSVKNKWSPIFKFFSLNTSSIIGSLIENPAQTANPTPTVLKVSHVKVQADVQINGSVAVNSSAVLVAAFLPEGIIVNSYSALGSFIETHPEYIMAHKVVPIPTNAEDQETNTVVAMTSGKLTRNLNSGDKIILGLYSNVPVYLNGTVTACVRAN